MTRLRAVAIVAISLAAIGRLAADPTAATGVYTPNAPAQLPPMRVEVIDSTTFRDIETGLVYGLYGVDSCRPDQSANLGRQHWPCGAVAAAWLVNATLGKWVSCNVLRELDGKRLARCSSSEHGDVAADMLKDGLAIVLPPERRQTIRAYVAAQDQAKKAFKGLWSSQFSMPWLFSSETPLPNSASSSPLPSPQ